jgi:hypothetical protein
MTSRISNEGVTDGIDTCINLPPTIIDFTQTNGTTITLHGHKWDGFDCELLDVEFPPPFCAHMFKSPVYFTGSFTSITTTLNDIARAANRTAPKAPPVPTTNFPVNSYSDTDFITDKDDIILTHDFEHTLETEDEDLTEAENISCDDSSNDEDYDDAHPDTTALDFEYSTRSCVA